ncbi:MAG: hypothetical protein IJ153_02450 [Clostridia bacterium]|nr:hypothetical protein [Clostridia bacterium]
MAKIKESEIRQNRAEMEQAKQRGEKSTSEQKLPRRYHLYDKIKENVSLRTIDGVIIAVSAAIILLLIYGIVTGTPPQ